MVRSWSAGSPSAYCAAAEAQHRELHSRVHKDPQFHRCSSDHMYNTPMIHPICATLRWPAAASGAKETLIRTRRVAGGAPSIGTIAVSEFAPAKVRPAVCLPVLQT